MICHISLFPNCTLYGSLTRYCIFEAGYFPGDKTTLHICSEGRNYIDVFHLYEKHYYVRLDMHDFYARIIGDKTHVRALSISDVGEKKHIKRKKRNLCSVESVMAMNSFQGCWFILVFIY